MKYSRKIFTQALMIWCVLYLNEISMKTLIGGFFIITLMSCSERKQFFLVNVNNGGMRVYK